MEKFLAENDLVIYEPVCGNDLVGMLTNFWRSFVKFFAIRYQGVDVGHESWNVQNPCTTPFRWEYFVTRGSKRFRNKRSSSSNKFCTIQSVLSFPLYQRKGALDSGQIFSTSIVALASIPRNQTPTTHHLLSCEIEHSNRPRQLLSYHIFKFIIKLLTYCLTLQNVNIRLKMNKK